MIRIMINNVLTQRHQNVSSKRWIEKNSFAGKAPNLDLIEENS